MNDSERARVLEAFNLVPRLEIEQQHFVTGCNAAIKAMEAALKDASVPQAERDLYKTKGLPAARALLKAAKEAHTTTTSAIEQHAGQNIVKYPDAATFAKSVAAAVQVLAQAALEAARRFDAAVPAAVAKHVRNDAFVKQMFLDYGHAQKTVPAFVTAVAKLHAPPARPASAAPARPASRAGNAAPAQNAPAAKPAAVRPPSSPPPAYPGKK